MSDKAYLSLHGCNVDQFVSAVEDLLGSDAADTVYSTIVRRNDETDIVVLEPSVILCSIDALNWRDVKSITMQIAKMYGMPDVWYIFTIGTFGSAWGR